MKTEVEYFLKEVGAVRPRSIVIDQGTRYDLVIESEKESEARKVQ